jgi:hypothetical protein
MAVPVLGVGWQHAIIRQPLSNRAWLILWLTMKEEELFLLVSLWVFLLLLLLFLLLFSHEKT